MFKTGHVVPNSWNSGLKKVLALSMLEGVPEEYLRYDTGTIEPSK
jgi:hypothetical protein